MKNVIPFRGDEVLKYAIYRDGRDSIVESETLVEGTNELSDILTEAHYSYGIYKPSSNGYWISNNTQDGTFKSVVIKKGDGNSLNQEENDFITALLNKGVYSENEDDGYSWSGKQNFGVGGWIFGGFIGAFLGYQLGKAVGYGRAHQGYALGGSVEDAEKIQQLVKKWVYFTFNYPNDFISDIWGNSFLDSHFKGKFAGFYSTYGTDGVMPNFYNALDGSNRIHLAKYILDNYKDYPVEGVSPEDFADVITHWNSFCFNFPFGWVQKTFNRDTNHFLAKWNKAYSDSNPSGAVNVFFTRLSGDNQDLLINWAIKNHNKGMGKFIHGGKAQGYNDKLDESLGNTTGRKSSMEQNYKDRRDESTSMMKSEGKRKYQRVGTMDKMNNGGNVYANTGEVVVQETRKRKGSDLTPTTTLYSFSSAQDLIEKYKKHSKFEVIGDLNKSRMVLVEHKDGHKIVFRKREIFENGGKMADGGMIETPYGKSEYDRIKHFTISGTGTYEEGGDDTFLVEIYPSDFESLSIENIYDSYQLEEELRNIIFNEDISDVSDFHTLEDLKFEVYMGSGEFFDVEDLIILEDEDESVNMSDIEYEGGGAIDNSDYDEVDGDDIAEYLTTQKYGTDWWDGENYKNEDVEAYYVNIVDYAEGNKDNPYIDEDTAEMVDEIIKEQYEGGGAIDNSDYDEVDGDDIAEYLTTQKYGTDWWDGENYKNEDVEAYYVNIVDYAEGNKDNPYIDEDTAEMVDEIIKEQYEGGGAIDNSDYDEVDGDDIAEYLTTQKYGTDWWDGENYKNEDVEAYYVNIVDYAEGNKDNPYIDEDTAEMVDEIIKEQYEGGGAIDNSDYNEVILSLLNETGEEFDEIDDNTSGNILDITMESGAEYRVYLNEDDAYDDAVERVTQDAEENLEYFNKDFVMRHLDSDIDKFFREVYDEMNVSYANDIKLEGDDKYDNRLIEEMVMYGLMSKSDAESGEASEIAEDRIDDFVETLTSDQMDSGGDGTNYYRDAFGEDELYKLLQNNNLIDIDSLSQDAVDTDGIGHFISSYDGNMIYLDNGEVAFRTN